MIDRYNKDTDNQLIYLFLYIIMILYLFDDDWILFCRFTFNS